jgi:NAD(P)-dependent dehydrogenase (short-subunit alcohol dehydrogenase family)
MNTILITGANRGIGLELSRQYYQDGWHVIACIRNIEQTSELDKLKNHPSQGRLSIYALDVTHPEEIHTLAKQLTNQPIDILFNNAGIWGASNQTLETAEPSAWLNTFNVNVISPLLMARAFVQHIEKSSLKIIANMSSIMGSISLNASSGEYIYRSSKAALNSVTKNLSIDLKDQDIIVVALHPGWVQTDMGGGSAPITPEISVKGLRKMLSSLSLEDTGNFISYDGLRLSW